MTDATRLRFLVVEDHGFQRWLVCNLLEQLGAEASFPVSDGRAALELLASSTRIDVVVSDLDMPGMDGMELIRHMAELPHPAALIVLSGVQPALLATVETMAREYGVNFLAAIEKPLTARKLQAALAQLRPFRQEGRSHPRAPAVAAEEIERALRDGQIEAFFQPKADIRTGHVVGAEALARWRHPEKGYLAPGTFMEVVESEGLIDSLTLRMAGEAIRNCREWRDAGLELTVAINLSFLTLSDPSLADRMLALVVASGLDPASVIFEITESVASRDLGPRLENLSRLRMRGFGLSIDDYGTGYSSMHRLSRIPFTELKIEQVFVRNAAADPASRAMVESSLELADKLGITSVAEGVEMRGEWEMLLGLGCAQAQGYFLARPMPGSEFLDWVRQRRLDCA